MASIPSENYLSVTVPVRIPLRVISDNLIAAFEGGSNYWYRIEKRTVPKEIPAWVKEAELEEIRHGWVCLAPGGSMEVSDYHGNEGEEGMTIRDLNIETVREGLAAMAKKYPIHFADLMNENGDAETGDVLLQSIVFGRVVYG